MRRGIDKRQALRGKTCCFLIELERKKRRRGRHCLQLSFDEKPFYAYDYVG